MSTSSIILLIHWILLLYSSSHLSVLEALHNVCERKCGNISIPYPFGIKESKCISGLPGFEIICNNSIPFLPTDSGDVQVASIGDDHLLIHSTLLHNFLCDLISKSLHLPPEGPFRISESNKLVTVGCNTSGVFTLNGGYSGYCTSFCSNDSISDIFRPCKKNGCCQIPFPAGYIKYKLGAYFFNGTDYTETGNRAVDCNYSASAIVDEDSAKLIVNSTLPNFKDPRYSMRVDWAILNETCQFAQHKGSYKCAPNAECENREWGYVCKCGTGYHGDGFSHGTGCKAVTCKTAQRELSYKCSPNAECEDRDRGYVCKCGTGYQGDGNSSGTGCKAIGKCSRVGRTALCFQTLFIIAGVCGSFLVLLLGSGGLFWTLKRRKSRAAKKKNFDRNGGAQFQKLISPRGVEAMKLFALEEIEKATNKFSQSLVLGSGGYGTVYKGTLTDGNIVAIKKSKEADAREINQFVNEVVILSQINHRNVVKILGCCLETPVPLLVYEYISNGTLFDHLHGDKYEQSHIVWEDRLRIATETAEALSYLHSAASIAIVHRDVKTSNILLDDRYNPKVADFGVSRLVPMGQTHVTTAVQGTMGYLDPEYFQTVQLTEKSDVYSFGVVLVELLTGLKPVSYERMKNQSNLAIFFLSTVNRSGLTEIIDPRLNVEESGNMESMRRVANLAKECLSVEGEKRPTMKEVVQELLWTRGGTRKHAWVDVNAGEKEEETVGLIAEVGPTKAVVDQCSVLSFNIEGLSSVVKSGR